MNTEEINWVYMLIQPVTYWLIYWASSFQLCSEITVQCLWSFKKWRKYVNTVPTLKGVYNSNTDWKSQNRGLTITSQDGGLCRSNPLHLTKLQVRCDNVVSWCSAKARVKNMNSMERVILKEMKKKIAPMVGSWSIKSQTCESSLFS